MTGGSVTTVEADASAAAVEGYTAYKVVVTLGTAVEGGAVADDAIVVTIPVNVKAS